MLLESIVNPYKTIAAGLGAEGSYSESFSADYFLETSPNNFELKFIPGKKDRISVFQLVCIEFNMFNGKKQLQV